MYPLPFSCHGYKNLLVFFFSCYFIEFFYCGVGFCFCFLKPEYHNPVKFKCFLWEFGLK